MQVMKQVRRFGAGAALAAVSGSALASAPTYDVSDATAAISAGEVAIGALGLAALVLVVGLKVWKRLRGAA